MFNGCFKSLFYNFLVFVWRIFIFLFFSSTDGDQPEQVLLVYCKVNFSPKCFSNRLYLLKALHYCEVFIHHYEVFIHHCDVFIHHCEVLKPLLSINNRIYQSSNLVRNISWCFRNEVFYEHNIFVLLHNN